MKYSNKLLKDYEADANLKLAFICRIMMVLLIMVMVFNITGVFVLESSIYPVIIVAVLIMFVPTILYDLLHKSGPVWRYFVLTLVVFMSGLLYSFLSYHVIIMLVFPIIVATICCDTRSIVYTTLLGIPVMVISHLIAFRLRIVPDEPLVTLKGVIVYGIFPRVIEYIAIAVICINLTIKIQRLIKALIDKNEELYEDQDSLITSLSEMIESQSQETGLHVKRVSEYTKILCRALGMDDEEVRKVGLASMMHDVGKILVPRQILEKPGKLTVEEFAEIKKHANYGRMMLEKSPGELMQISARIAGEHHERYDGTGYNKMAGDDIHIYSKCVSVADVFDALVSWRPYKEPWNPQDARDEIVRQSGKQFDPDVVKVFDEHFEEVMEVYRQYPDSVKEIDTEIS